MLQDAANNVASDLGTAGVEVGPSMMDRFFEAASASVLYTVLGVILFGISFLVIIKVTPFSVRREIEEDQNVALGIIIASFIIGISLIVSAAIRG